MDAKVKPNNPRVLRINRANRPSWVRVDDEKSRGRVASHAERLRSIKTDATQASKAKDLPNPYRSPTVARHTADVAHKACLRGA